MAEVRPSDRSTELRPAILLVDMDSFYASIEQRDDPSLADRPVLVGGEGGRGVVASCSYEARRYGIRSAMPMVTARRLCPEAVVLGVRMPHYASVSRELRRILLDHSPLVEPLGLDEAFVDVTGAVQLLGSPYEIARSIERRISAELHLHCGIGVGPSKLIAKLASRDAKPMITRSGIEPGLGVVVVLADDVARYLEPLSVRALFGVGPATARRLARLGIEQVFELARMDPAVLAKHVGHHAAQTLIGLARGDDPRPVVADLPSKSIGNEETFSSDVDDQSVLVQRLRNQALGVSGALRSSGQRARTITVKAKYGDFTAVSRSHTMLCGVDDHVAILAVATALLEAIDVERGLRLIGISTSQLEEASAPVQLRLDVGARGEADDIDAGQVQLERAALDDAVDEIRARFGRQALRTASMLPEESSGRSSS
jgi:DNA polymerase-4